MAYDYTTRARELMLLPAEAEFFVQLNEQLDANGTCPRCGAALGRYEYERMRHVRTCPNKDGALDRALDAIVHDPHCTCPDCIHDHAQTLSTVPERVIARLAQDGLTATWEYPGYVSIPAATPGRTWAFGTANETWAGDYGAEDGSRVIAAVNTGIASDSDDVEAIAAAILAAVRS